MCSAQVFERHCIARCGAGKAEKAGAGARCDDSEIPLPGGAVRTTKRTEITIETDRILVLSKHKVSIVSWCRECRQQIKMVTVDEAAIIGGVSPRAIYRSVEAQAVHFLERADGLLLICPKSLPTSDPTAGPTTAIKQTKEIL